MYTVNDANLPWLKNVHNIINECGLAYIWNTQTFINSDVFISLVNKRLKTSIINYGTHKLKIPQKP
jgi:hypothetical protein